MTAPTLLAQLTDTHVVEPDTDEVLYVDNNERVAAAVASIKAEAPAVDAVVATGDLTQWGQPTEYATLATLLDPLTVPVLPLPGNHDDRDGLRECFPDHPWADTSHASWVVVVGAVRIVGLDTTLPGEPGAEFDTDRERWLTSTLARDHDGPTILAMHHPPFRTGIGWMDDNGFLGLDRLEGVLSVAARSRAVDRILCGHLHRPISSAVAGIPAEVGISTAVHVALDLRPGGPVRIVRDPAGYRLFAVDGVSIVGHTRYTEPAAAAFTPDWADLTR